MKKPDFLNFEPVYDPRPYKKIPKVRGIIFSLAISLVVWATSTGMLTGVFAAIFLAISPRELELVGLYSMIGIAAVIEFLARGTAYICFLGCRTWTSLPKVVMFSLFGKRHHSGNLGDINRINIFGF
ncbi:MAG: hypothetical protein PHH28_04815 [Desulfuromonadaceae bacterium]|nr:hypothetical protein [Desulfuromonadaceae bacterium]